VLLLEEIQHKCTRLRRAIDQSQVTNCSVLGCGTLVPRFSLFFSFVVHSQPPLFLRSFVACSFVSKRSISFFSFLSFICLPQFHHTTPPPFIWFPLFVCSCVHAISFRFFGQYSLFLLSILSITPFMHRFCRPISIRHMPCPPSIKRNGNSIVNSHSPFQNSHFLQNNLSP
jgi:hypothetical protein